MNYYKDTSEELFLIEGKLSQIEASKFQMLDLHSALSTMSSTKTGLLLAGAGAVLQNGTATSSGNFLAMYQGERVQTLHCCIGDKAVIGEFCGVKLLDVGDEVRAVVSKRGGILYVYAIQRLRDELLWLPIETYAGCKGAIRGISKLMGVYWFLTLIVMTIFSIILKSISMFLLFSILSIIFYYFLGLALYLKIKPLYIRAQKIFTVLGFPDPELLDMKAGRYRNFHAIDPPGATWNYESVFYYQLVINSHLSGKKIKLRADKLPVETLENREEVKTAYTKIKEKYAPNLDGSSQDNPRTAGNTTQ